MSRRLHHIGLRFIRFWFPLLPSQVLGLLTVLIIWAVAGCATQPVLVETFDDPVLAPSARTLSRALAVPAPDPGPLFLPDHTRQIDEGYWLGAMLDADNVDSLERLGIAVVLSAVRPSDETLGALADAQIELVSVPMGSTFRHADDILSVVDAYPSNQVFIHCRHGADRSGAMAAFLLVVRHEWGMADALYSVLYRSDADVEGLIAILRQRGIDDVRTVDDPTVGFYSVAAAGGVGGMKARNERYGRLIETTIDAMLFHADWPQHQAASL